MFDKKNDSETEEEYMPIVVATTMIRDTEIIDDIQHGKHCSTIPQKEVGKISLSTRINKYIQNMIEYR